MIIDLTSEQSRVYQDKKELVIIQPMEIQPPGKYEGTYTFEFSVKVGQEITIRQEWREISEFKGAGEKPYNILKSAKIMPKELWKTGKVTEIMEPIKIDGVWNEQFKIKGE